MSTYLTSLYLYIDLLCRRSLVTDFTEFEFKTHKGDWIRTCIDSKKIDTIMEKLACYTDVRLV